MSKKGGYWISISDIMSAMMIVFLFISVAFLAELQEQQKTTDQLVQGYSDTKGDITKALHTEFDKDLNRWGATLDDENMSISFEDPDALFAQGSAELSPRFQEILNDFLPRYIELITRPEYKDEIQEVRIEGHTSSEWEGEMETDNSYFNNMRLSQQRTRAVLQYMFKEFPLNPDNKAWMMEKITANGLSYSQRKYMPDGHEDMQKSRRVEFRIRTNSEELMKKLEKLKDHNDKVH